MSGGLPPAMRLPSSRALASDLGVSRITVANAYAELDRDGLIASREGSGTFVAAAVSVPSRAPESNGQSWPLWQQESRRSAAGDTAPSTSSAPRTDRVHRCRRSANVPRQRVRQDHQGGPRSRRHRRAGVRPLRSGVRPAARDRGATARQPGNPHQRPTGADHIRLAAGDRIDLPGAAQTRRHRARGTTHVQPCLGPVPSDGPHHRRRTGRRTRHGGGARRRPPPTTPPAPDLHDSELPESHRGKSQRRATSPTARPRDALQHPDPGGRLRG